MKRALLAAGGLGLLGCSTFSGTPRPATPSFTCEGPRYPEPRPRYRADMAMGRLEVEKLPPREEPPAPEEQKQVEAAEDADTPRLPDVRLRVLAEAVPLGTFASALSRELERGIVVTPPLVDVRVSLTLPDTTAEELFRLLRVHYSVAESIGTHLILLEDGEEVRRRRFEPQELLLQVVPVEGLPVEQVATAFCQQVASGRGSASVIGDLLLVKDDADALWRFQHLLDALRKQGKDASPTDPVSRP